MATLTEETLVALNTWIADAVAILERSIDLTTTIRDQPWKLELITEHNTRMFVVDHHRPRVIWQPSVIDSLTIPPSWERVTDLVRSTSNLLATRVISRGTADEVGGGFFALCTRILPEPTEMDAAGEVVATRTKELIDFLASGLQQTTTWFLTQFDAPIEPLQIRERLELDEPTDYEIERALNAGLLVPDLLPEGNIQIQRPGTGLCCLRYSDPVLPIESDGEEEAAAGPPARDHQELWAELGPTLRMTLGLLSSRPVGIAGPFTITTKSRFTGESAIYVRSSVQISHYGGSGGFTARQSDGPDFTELWSSISRLVTDGGSRGLRMALRRLSQWSDRDDLQSPYDSFLDVMIAAESLYMSELGSEKSRGELKYRLALRAAFWANLERLKSTKIEICRLMSTAYDNRSILAHGAEPKEKDWRKVATEFDDLHKQVRDVVVDGCLMAIEAQSAGNWPPSWDDLIMPAAPTSSS